LHVAEEGENKRGRKGGRIFGGHARKILKSKASSHHHLKLNRAAAGGIKSKEPWR